MDSVAPEPKEFELTKARLWLFRIAFYSIPFLLVCSAIYCVIYHVPNPRSVVPKSVILLIEAVTIAMYICQAEWALRGPKAKSGERRFVVIFVPIFVALIWIVLFVLRNNSEVSLTGDGDPFFPIIWFVIIMCRWMAVEKPVPANEATL